MSSRLPAGPPRETLKIISVAKGDPTYFLELSDEYGDVFSIDFGQKERVTLLSDPEYIRQIFSSNKKSLESNNAELFKILGENGLFSLTGDEHLQTRKMLNSYLGNDQISNYISLTEKASAVLLDDWPSEKIVKTRPMFMALYRKVIQNIIFGAEREEQTNQLMNLISEVLDFAMHQSATVATLVMNLDGTYMSRYIKQKNAYLDEQINVLIEEIKKEKNLESKNDFISNLIFHKKDNGEKLSNKEIRDHVMTIITAGHETNSVASSFILDALAHDTDTQNYLANNLDDLEYFEMVAKETLRLTPPVHFTHKLVTSPFDLFDYSFIEGDVILISIFLTNRNQKYWGNPHKFLPRRWKDRPPNQYAWIPFGTGAHRCIGARLALGQLAAVTREVVKRYELVAINEPEKFITRSIVNAPKKDGELFLKAR